DQTETTNKLKQSDVWIKLNRIKECRHAWLGRDFSGDCAGRRGAWLWRHRRRCGRARKDRLCGRPDPVRDFRDLRLHARPIADSAIGPTSTSRRNELITRAYGGMHPTLVVPAEL